MILLLALNTALAQETFTVPIFNAQLYRPTIDGDRTLWTDDAVPAPKNWGSFRVGYQYLNGPVGAVFEDNKRINLVSSATALDLIGGIGFGKVRVGFHAPYYVSSKTDLDAVSTGFGDIGIDVKGSLLDPRVNPIGLALSTRLSLGTGNIGIPLRSEGPTWEISAIVDKRINNFTLLGNLGTSGVPAMNDANLNFKGALAFRAGLGWTADEIKGLSLDLAGRAVYRTLPDIAGIPVEADVGGWWRFNDTILVRAAVGTGLTTGVGSPAFRTLLSVGWEPIRDADADSDVVVDRLDQCPDVPEDIDGFEDDDGCPDPDNDGDGLLDAVDQCPNEAEDIDGYLDNDGCVDPLTHVQIKVTDPDGRLIGGVQSSITQADAKPITGGGHFESILSPSSYTLLASAEGYEPIEQTFDVKEGAPAIFEFKMTPIVVMGIVNIRVRGPNLTPLDATISIGEEQFKITGGEGELTLMGGTYDLVAVSEGYLEDTFPVEVVADDTAYLLIRMEPTYGQLHLKVVDLNGAAVPDVSWTPDETELSPLEAGEITTDLQPGDYTITVSAPGFQDTTLPAALTMGELTELEVVLQPARVTITKSRIELSEKVFFQTGKATILPHSFPLLDEVATILVEHPEIEQIRVEGHTDSRGSEANNLRLSERRAASVRDYLISKQVGADRLISEGWGETRPLDEAKTQEAYSKNRRVELHIVDDDAEHNDETEKK